MGRSLNDRTANFRCGHPKLHIRPKILECADPRQRNGTSRVSIRWMVLQLFLVHTFQKVVIPFFLELGPHKSRRLNNRFGQLPIPFSFKCAGMLAYCSFLIEDCIPTIYMDLLVKRTLIVVFIERSTSKLSRSLLFIRALLNSESS